jgi:S1-C subfamily serine protease
MRLHSLLVPALVIPTLALSAQVARVYRAPTAPSAGRFFHGGDDESRAALGLSIGGSGSTRDTLGLLVTSVTPNGPAERAGIQEGDRLASINGVSLRLDPSDAGDVEIGNAMSRRLTRELSRVQAGEEVDLRVYADGRTRNIRVRTADSDSLYTRRRVASTASRDDRATLGIGVASTNSRRDSLGVLVMFVDDSGPAGLAGIEEGNRIAAINDVDLRTGRDDAGDESVANSRIQRLQREVARLQPGDRVELRLYANGEMRNVRLRAARASDLPRRKHAFVTGGDGLGMGMMPGAFPLGLDGGMLSDQVRRSIERAMSSAGIALEGIGRGLGRVRLRDNDDDVEMPRVRPMEPMEPMEPIHIEPLEPSRLRRIAPRKLPMVTTLLDDSSVSAPMVAAATLVGEEPERASSNAALDIAGLRMVPVGAELASYLGKGSERGLLVVEVPDWARRAIRPGDVVLSLDSRPVRVRDRSDEVNFALPRYREAELDILRDGVHHSVTLPARR